jgi:hypothetical protein
MDERCEHERIADLERQVSKLTDLLVGLLAIVREIVDNQQPTPTPSPRSQIGGDQSRRQNNRAAAGSPPRSRWYSSQREYR